jgi:hypothetical protein
MNGNPMMQILQMFTQSPNPSAMLQTHLQNNPALATQLNQIQNSTKGSNPKDIAMNMARQRGIPEQQVMQWFNSLNR